MSELIHVDKKLFVGRIEEQKQFRAALQELFHQPADEELPYVCIVYGDGGMGKTTLLRRFRDIALTEAPFAGKFQFLWIDWEDERKKFPSLQVGRNQISEEAVFKTMHVAAVRQKWGRQFAAYRKALKQRETATKQVAELLASDNSAWDEAEIVRSIGVDALAKIIRIGLPMIGDAGEELVESFLEAGITVGIEQAIKLRTALENHLRATLNARHFDYFLNPQEQLALSIARGLNRVARKKYLVVVLDSYELIDRVDIWMRVVQRGAGSRVLWIISDRHNLLQSRQFGRDYFKGYADDFPRRLLGYQMRPLAIPHIHTYFRARVPERRLSREETEAISRVTRGIPLAVREAAEIWNAGASLHEIIGDITGNTPGSQIVKKMTDRYLQHVVLETDRQALFALMLARGDVEVLRAMLQPAGEDAPTVNLEHLLRRLERDYASVHATRARLHDDPALFFREYLKAPVRRTGEQIRQLNERALTVLQERLTALEEDLAHLDERCRDDNWVHTALGVTRHLFWLEEKEAWKWFIPRYIEGMAYNRDLQNGLVHIAEMWQGHLSANGEYLLQALRDGGTGASQQLKTLQQLRERGWLAGDGEQEREAILDLQQSALWARSGQIEKALASYRQVEAMLEEEHETLRRLLADAYENLARRALTQKAPPELPAATAIRLVQQVVAWFPRHQRAWSLLGRLHAQNGALSEAVTAFQHVVELATREEIHYRAAYQWLGTLYEEMGRQKQARAAYEAVLAVAPDDRQAHASLGALFLAQGEVEKAEAAYESAIAGTTPEDADIDALLGLARLHLQGERYRDAQELYLHVLARQPQHVDAARGVGEAAYHLGELQSALAHLREAAILDPRDAETRCILARVYHRGLGELRPALVAYERALAAADAATPVPIRIEAHVGLGDIHREGRRFEQALTAYGRALELEPHTVEAHEGLACVYGALGRYEEALAAHEQAIEAAGQEADNYPFAYDNLGDVNLALGHYGEAATAYEAALDLNPEDASVQAGLGDARLRLGQIEAAREAYRRTLALKQLPAQTEARALRGMGDILAAAGDLGDASITYERALELAPEDGNTHLHLAYVRARQEYRGNRQKDAEIAFRRAARLSRDDARPYGGLGDLYRYRKRTAAARAAYHKALALDPALTPAYVGLGTLLAQAGHEEQALDAYRRALEVEGGTDILPQSLASSRAEAHRRSGDIYRRQANQASPEAAPTLWRQARKAYEQAIELAPRSPHAFVGLGNVFRALRQLDEAETAYRQALELGNTDDTQAALAYYGLGRIFQTQQRPDEAEAALQQAARLQPHWQDPHVGLGLLYATRGEALAAVQSLERALAEEERPQLPGQSPDQAVPLSVLGDQYLLLERFEEATTAYRRALAAEGRLRPIRRAHTCLGQGDALRALGQLVPAEEAYQRAMAIQEDLPPDQEARAQLGLAAIFLERDEPQDAEKACRRALELDPKDEDRSIACYRLGEALAGQSAYAEAADAYRQALKSKSGPSSRAAVYQGLAQAEYLLGHYPEALAAYQERQACLPARAPDGLLGQIYAALGQEKQAEAAYQAALEAEPRDASAVHGLGVLYLKSENARKALRYFQRAIRLQPQMAASYAGLAQAYADLGEDDLAHAACRKALQAPQAAEEDLAAAHTILGSLHLRESGYRQAIRAYQRALARSADPTTIYRAASGLGAAYLALSSWEEAAAAYRQAVGATQDEQETAAALLGLGRAEAERGRPEIAISTYERALRSNPEEPELYFHLGLAYATVEQHEAAIKAFQSSLSLDPNPAGTRATLFLEQGRSALALGRHTDAQKAYERTLSLTESTPDTINPLSLHLLGGDLWRAMEKYDEARQAYETVLTLASEAQVREKAQAALGLGEIYFALEQYQKAIAAYRRALQFQPDYTAALSGLGATYNRQGESRAAVEAYEQAVALPSERTARRAADFAGLAQAYAHLGRNQAACSAYERALAHDPHLTSAYVALGKLLHAEGEPERALTCFRSALDLDSEWAETHEALGHTQLALDQYDAAEKAFSRAVALAPQRGSAYQGLGRALQKLDREVDALAAYEQARSLGVEDAALYRALGTLYLHRGQPEAALATLQNARGLEEDNPDVYALLGAVCETLEEEQEAFHNYQQALALDDTSARAHCGLGNIYRRRDHHYDAMVAYRRALENAPEFAPAFHGIARTYRRMGRPAEALAAAERAVALTSKPDSILLFLGDLYRQQGSLASALEAYSQLLLEASGRPVLLAAGYSGMGNVYLAQERWEEAREAFEQALAQKPEHADAVAGLADVDAAAGDLARALTGYERALELAPEQSRTYTGLANLYVRQGQLDEALNTYQEAIALDPQNPLARAGLGDAYRLMDRTDEALAVYRRAIRLNAHLPAPYIGQGHVYRTLQRPYEALKSYQQAVKLKPHLPTYLAMGEIFLTWGHASEAAEAYENAIALAPEETAPDAAPAYLGLGHVYREQERYDEAIAAYNMAAQITNEKELAATVQANLADLYNMLGQMEHAAAAYRQAVRLQPDDALSYGSLAGLYRKLGHQQAYEKAVAKARQLMAEESEYNRACLEAIAGDAQQAIALLRVALRKRQVDPAWICQDPDFDFLRDTPAFQALVRCGAGDDLEPSEAPAAQG